MSRKLVASVAAFAEIGNSGSVFCGVSADDVRISSMRNRTAQATLKTSLRTAIALSTALMWCVAAHAASTDNATAIDKLMSTPSKRGQVNGAILIAKPGEIIYRMGFGEASFQTGVDFTPETSSDIGSITKQFTAMAIMILAEQENVWRDVCQKIRVCFKSPTRHPDLHQ
jgi:CubicO group peptidase (beta-lactamase class C family)